MDFQTILLGTLCTILTGLLTWAVERLTAFLNSKIKNTKALGYLTDALGIVADAVKATYQTYVQALKNKDLFDATAQKIALEKAINQAKNQLSADTQNYITEIFGDVNSWLKTQIEAVLYDLKNK